MIRKRYYVGFHIFENCQNFQKSHPQVNEVFQDGGYSREKEV